jgi:hypothetical protein
MPLQLLLRLSWISSWFLIDYFEDLNSLTPNIHLVTRYARELRTGKIMALTDKNNQANDLLTLQEDATF